MCKKRVRKTKKPELPRRSVSNFDQDVFDYALEDGCVKVANVKSVKKSSPGRKGRGKMLPSAHKNTLRVPGCAGQARGGEGRGRLIIVCGAPRLRLDGAIIMSYTRPGWLSVCLVSISFFPWFVAGQTIGFSWFPWRCSWSGGQFIVPGDIRIVWTRCVSCQNVSCLCTKT